MNAECLRMSGDGSSASSHWCARFRRAALAMLVLLCQFALGIATNLYVTVPSRHPGAKPGNYLSGSIASLGWAVGHGGLLLAAHTLLGMALVIAALAALVAAVRLGDAGPIAAAGAGAAFVIGAGFNGASFLDFAENANSLVMALLFALAVLSYVIVLYTLAPYPHGTREGTAGRRGVGGST
jgi:hypothetical protein